MSFYISKSIPVNARANHFYISTIMKKKIKKLLKNNNYYYNSVFALKIYFTFTLFYSPHFEIRQIVCIRKKF